jgi:protein involved in polysaccharide export with SLBB domain
VVTSFDLYDLLLRGDRSADQLLQPDDVIHVGPVGPQVALIGSVNRPAIYEIRASETIDDVLQMAGGFNAVADSQRLVLERMSVPNAERMTQINVGADRSMALRNGDLLRALNAADVQRPIGQQNKRVRIEGEVGKPGEYIMPPDSTLLDALGAAGGLTTNAYLYAAVLTRESVRVTQQQNYERALRDFETQITSAAATRRAGTPEEVTALTAANAANSRLLQQLRNLRPSGRIVLQLPTNAPALPELVLEDGDRLNIPARPTTVGVFGSVFSTGSYLYSPSRTVGDYLRLAGGPTRGADSTSVFVIRANGSVNSSLQESGFFSRGNQIADLSAEPGDTIFVPEELDKTTWVQNAKDWTQILYQFGIGLAGIKSAVQ